MYKSILKAIDSQKQPKYNSTARSVADTYVASKGLPTIQHGVDDVKVDKDRASKVADAYHRMQHDPNHPEVKASYNSLISETSDQFGHLMDNGLKISKITPGMESPYKTSKDLHRDISENNHMWFFPTESGFGSDESQPKDHPMLAATQHLHEGKPLLANDIFRIVHDYFGHAKEGTQFGPKGEEAAWRTHKKMYSPQAQKALTTETRGQNSWVNFGPHGEHNRTNPQQTIYAPQKAGILPDWAHEHESYLKKNEDEDEFGEQSHHAERRYSYTPAKLRPIDATLNSIRDRLPHFIFSVEHPRYPEQNRLKMNHDQMLQFLQDRGYHAESLQGKYGDEEKSIIVHNPPKHAVNHLFNLAHKSGQESSIYSDGYNHEMHYHHGENAGKHLKGQGTHHHKKEPDDFYSKTQDGTIFTHSFNWDEQHPHDKSAIKIKPEKIYKSEALMNRAILIKNEDEKHPLETAGPETKLIHYSSKEGLKELDPKYHGVRGIGAETKQGQPDHPMSFFYLENTKPEDIVTGGSTRKYVAEKGKMKFYDVGRDPDNIYSKLREGAMNRQVNPGMVRREDYHQAIKDAGYHGIYNSSLGPTMRNVVGAFYRVPLKSEHRLHQNDYKMTSAKDHHEDQGQLQQARKFAKENQHHNPNFLHKLVNSFKGKI